MIIDEDSKNSSSFSFYTHKELEEKDCIKQKADYFFNNDRVSSVEHGYIRSVSVNQHRQKNRDGHIESNAHTTEFLRFLKTFGTCFDPN